MRIEELGKINELEVLGKGHEGVCYNLGNGNALKLYGDVRALSEIEKFKYMLKHKNESFLFPFEFIFDDEYFLGYITKKSLGITLEKSFNSLDLETLSTHSVPLEYNIKQLSQEKILLDDFHEGNIMYDKEKLEVIDTDFYETNVDLPLEIIKKKNLDYYKLTIAGLLKRGIMCTKKTRYIIDKITKYEFLTMSGSEMLIKVKEDMEKYYKEQINKIEDLHTILRR